MPHRERERFVRRCVVHVSLRVRGDVPPLRRERVARQLRQSLAKGCAKPGFSICEFSVQGNHLHLVCEADNHVALGKGMQGFGISSAKAINRACGRRKGSVYAERYAVTRVKTATQMRALLCYVLNNARRHGASIEGADVYSSARYFAGWARPTGLAPPDPDEPLPVAPAQTALLASRWRYIGLIDPDEMPAAGR